MARKRSAGFAVVLITMTFATVASAETLPVATVGDRMGSLLTRLRSVDEAVPRSCLSGGPIASHVNTVMPGRPADEGNAPFGNGLITNVWPIENVPAPCAAIQETHHQP